MASTHYSVLGVSPAASQDEIKRQFKKLAVKYHPDKTDDAKHHEMFLRIRKAYEILIDDVSRRDYDVQNGISVAKASSSSHTDSYNNNFRSHHGFSYYSPGTSYGGGATSYYSFFQHNYRAYTDAAKNHFESHERPSRNDDDDAATAAAKLAQKKMKEDMERRRQDQMYEAQRQRQELERRQRERKMREQMEQQLREQRERVREHQQRTRDEESYIRSKVNAQRRQWDNFYEISESDEEVYEDGQQFSQGGAEDEPIVVEDEADSSDNFEDCHASPPDGNGHGDSTLNGSDTKVKREQGLHTPSAEPEVVEVRSNDGESSRSQDKGFSNGPASPKRPLAEDQHGEEFTAHKKHARNIDMSDLRSSLGTSIDDTNFKDMLDSLPRSFGTSTSQSTNGPPSPGKTRKSSNSVHKVPNKRTKFGTYSNPDGFSDGRARAETLHTPVNKAPSRRNNSITVTDLSPDFDERRLMFTAEPPTVHVTPDLTTEQWLRYASGIHEYERGFAAFRSAVFEHQNLRFQKDERHHDTIYDDTSCLDAFSNSLFNDMLILQNYGRALQEFRSVVKTFRKNCELKREIETRENTRI
ncbi:hypothetical protein FT663_04852 [Candidozyma haemuli var. vulneris]|uniref:J domain-containing protein n=1 Tax=Candidozyma haemuli TaxID=45357 RepID=A0A2V1AWA5_9ASCO|nr:hypothetical protein CXQ85_004751 [[Candida] haemuloni]KAF3986542.1 hypothetical protein FT663_04852 [[Candida] haemuloni var. vulneris]PVH22082.1 hypothetical protein CXQ85_004751 [[Candida] haemuloni]